MNVGSLSDEESPKGRLAATKRVRIWLVGKPKLAAETTGPTDENGEKLNIPAIIFRLILLCVTLCVVVVVACWTILGVTVMPTVQAGGQSWLVRIGMWTEGSAPTGTPVFVLPQKVERDALTRATLMVSPSDGNSVVTVVARPGQPVSVSAAGTWLVDGQDTGIATTGVKFKNDGGHYLSVCQIGDCGAKGQIVTVPVNQVLGEVLYGVGLNGISSPPGISS